jgi:colanic acid biosynthesis glycosyl transferase WcaI
VVFKEFRTRLYADDLIDGIRVLRTPTWATPSKSFWPRILSFGSFCASSISAIAMALGRADIVYSILPPLPLGVSGAAIASLTGAKLVVNVQDIYPDIAVSLGFLKNKNAIRLFRSMERWIYRKASKIVVISNGFQENLQGKGVPAGRCCVVPNWADADEIAPAERENRFRRAHGLSKHFVVMYCGGLTLNSNLEPLLDAAKMLEGTALRCVIAGDGARKAALLARAAELQLTNVLFLPFQPLEEYPEALGAADATLVALDSSATFASVPSKVYKQMAAARPVIALTNPGNELTRLIDEAQCGVWIRQNDAGRLRSVLLNAMENGEWWEQMGWNGRDYLLQNCSRKVCVDRILSVLQGAVAEAAAPEIPASSVLQKSR